MSLPTAIFVALTVAFALTDLYIATAIFAVFAILNLLHDITSWPKVRW